VHRWLTGDALDRGRGIVQRWGVAAVPLCYLTVGVQTVVLASAGVIRMPWPRFTLAQSLGALAWAAIYSTVGFAVWAGLARAAVTGGPWPAVGLVLLVVVLTVVTWRRYRSDPLSRPPSARPSPPRPR
jgi:membrane protein DedA with SNARE-associated domain